jgi:hypothetical protein
MRMGPTFASVLAILLGVTTGARAGQFRATTPRPRDFDAPDYLDRRRAISACAWSRALRTA